ncbi:MULTISPECIES: purple acid phosphatase family protein [Cyanophyceae]|uniref:purple acid phosphatase family protein n=1 Tax=Cyanophyceae TaxID=3028117 RepID=UPI00168A04CE|nr:metallophosphoesterase family protein [Trichocoleus sp. FACHB-40]MBD2002321.1 metallophosphoesterase family protein [Trichocoleus sp. FACHB-40]
MFQRLTSRTILAPAVFLLLAAVSLIIVLLTPQPVMTSQNQLLTAPFLQLPSETSVRVVWFTEFAGTGHRVAYGENFAQSVVATTTKLSRTREDEESKVGNQTEDNQYQQPTRRDIWRHEAEVTELTPGKRVPYRVTSEQEDGEAVTSEAFTLAPKPPQGTPLKILLTSDHQLKPMTAANLQKAVETMGKFDAVFMVGDLVNVPDRASEWFDDDRGGAFFPCFQGRAKTISDRNGIKTVYRGGEIIQHAPIYTAIGNHEVMGRFSMDKSLNQQFDDSFPRKAAEEIYTKNAAQLNNSDDPKVREAWLKDNSFNTDTYEEIFTLPQSKEGGEKYYALTFGDVRLVVLYATNMWRYWGLEEKTRGRYREREQDLNNPENWGYGQHIFEPIAKGSKQYKWLETELSGSEFREAKYKMVMLHHPPHSLGDNIVPAYTDPVQVREVNADGSIKSIRYEYPKEADYIIRDVKPLLEAAGVQLVFYGHSHLWNRFVSPSGMHFLETSNVGNSYGAAVGDKKRPVPDSFNKENYPVTGDPNGLQAVVPTIAPLMGEDGKPLPYVASNEITAFSILDTGTGTVSSYRFDTVEESKVVKFDEFRLN